MASSLDDAAAGSVAQPAPTDKKANTWFSATDGSVAQPARPTALHMRKLAFYNIGWQSTEKKRDAAWLAREVSDIVSNKNVDAIGISEVFGQREDLKQWRGNIMSELLEHLNQGSAGQPVWQGKTYIHHIFLWKSNSFELLDYDVVSCGIIGEPARKAQYFEFRPAGINDSLYAFHLHNSVNPKLTSTNKKRE